MVLGKLPAYRTDVFLEHEYARSFHDVPLDRIDHRLQVEDVVQRVGEEDHVVLVPRQVRLGIFHPELYFFLHVIWDIFVGPRDADGGEIDSPHGIAQAALYHLNFDPPVSAPNREASAFLAVIVYDAGHHAPVSPSESLFVRLNHQRVLVPRASLRKGLLCIVPLRGNFARCFRVHRFCLSLVVVEGNVPGCLPGQPLLERRNSLVLFPRPTFHLQERHRFFLFFGTK
mmetsp:Transcript_5667/g.8597  ORF Transcript_5667/g.8597 Transcript_5667/m.8597 type:complete len:228 (+) Transcript_5667:5553-6236(+)